MIFIKPSRVPEFLRNSAFFASLSEGDDEEVSVPQDCCKLDTSVAHAVDLEKLLRTLRFWGVNKLPETAISFIFSSPLICWEVIAANYVRDLSCLADLMEIVNCSRERQVCKAVKQENMGALKYLLEQGYPIEFKSDDPTDVYTSHAANIAAGKGNLEMLKLLQECNCPFHQDTVIVAAFAGQIASLEFVLQNGCELVDNLVNYAFASGNVQCLRYVHEILKCSWTSNLLQGLQLCAFPYPYTEEGMLQCLQYAVKHGYSSYNADASALCAVYNLPQLLQYLHEGGCPWDEETVAAAANYGHLSCLQYAIEHDCPVPDSIFCFAVLGGNVDIIPYLFERGLPWPVDILRELKYGSCVEADMAGCLFYAYKLGCPRDPSTCFYASKYGFYDTLVDAHQRGCRWDENCCMLAAQGGHINCLVYLHENGCPWDDYTTKDALRHKKYDCLQYAVEQGCPASTATVDKYKALVEEGVI